VTDELRDVIVPINKKYPIRELMQACRSYLGLNNARRITFEYVMLKDVNDSPADARALVKLVQGIPTKVNLIPFNPWPGAPFERSTPQAIKRCSDIVFEAGYSSPVRTPRGEDILHGLSIAHRDELAILGPALVTALRRVLRRRA
ncbi:MAG TPA: hypothetical protein PL196_11930, partial [Burkholderiaceae bacterium]|nr:hypothetical protein [Burkholderiaceae bacterium]